MVHKTAPVEGSRSGDSTDLGNGNDDLTVHPPKIKDGPKKPMYPPPDEYYSDMTYGAPRRHFEYDPDYSDY